MHASLRPVCQLIESDHQEVVYGAHAGCFVQDIHGKRSALVTEMLCIIDRTRRIVMNHPWS